MDIGRGGNGGSADADGGIYRWGTHQSMRKSEKENEAGSTGSSKTIPGRTAGGGECGPGGSRKKPLDDGDEPPEIGGRKRDNTSKDPECGVFHKGEHKRCFAYEAHTACDKNGYVLEAVVTPGNVHESVAFDDVYGKLIQSFPEVETVVADAACKTPHICKKVFQNGRVLSKPTSVP